MIENRVLEQRKITVNELPSEVPDFTSTFEPKESIVKKWIINWIMSAIEKKTIKENDILPKKSEISDYLGVSVGTVQNAIRYVEDEGYLKSKQRLGTMISCSSNPITQIKKSTSKRDKSILAVQRVIMQKEYSIGKPIPSTRKMAEILGVSQNTTRLAYEYLSKIGIIESKRVRGNDSSWILKDHPTIPDESIKDSENLSSDTLVKKLTQELKVFLAENFKIGDKIPSHDDLARSLNVSVKTIHDAVKQLSNEGVVISRRGRYGTILSKDPFDTSFEPLKESSIFAKADEAAIYSYQKIESKIINLIKTNYKIGDKLPSMKELALNFDVSTNTIRKALNNLSNEGYITFGRGRFGGTFLVDIPEEIERQPYQWLSINPKYI